MFLILFVTKPHGFWVLWSFWASDSHLSQESSLTVVNACQHQRQGCHNQCLRPSSQPVLRGNVPSETDYRHLKQKIPELDNTNNNHICNIYIHINHLFFVNYVLHTEQTQLSFISISTPTSKKTHHISMTPHDFLQVGGSSGLRLPATPWPNHVSNRMEDMEIFTLKRVGQSESVALFWEYLGVSWWNKRFCKIVDTPMLKMYKNMK